MKNDQSAIEEIKDALIQLTQYVKYIKELLRQAYKNETAATGISIPKKQMVDPQIQKDIAAKIIEFLSGYNRLNQKIMRDSDFNRLSNYIFTLIETGAIPQDIQSISQTGVTNVEKETTRKKFAFMPIHYCTDAGIKN